jgi:hypothetical protein
LKKKRVCADFLYVTLDPVTLLLKCPVETDPSLFPCAFRGIVSADFRGS